MPVPVPRQREVPAAGSGPADLLSHPKTDRLPAPHQTGPVDAADPAIHHEGRRDLTDHSDRADHAGHVALADQPVRPARTGPAAGQGPAAGDGPAAPEAAADHTAGTTLLVIEDDPTDALALPDMVDAAGKRVRIRTARNLTEANRLLTDDVHCILLDLALPTPLPVPGDESRETSAGEPRAAPGDELEILRQVLRIAPNHAVLALTAETDAERAAEAVRVGAQDYLFRDELDGRLLSRAIRYAVERKRSDLAQRQLAESRVRAQENARLERGLLPTPLLEGSDLRFASRYRPGRSRALLGGDFYDTVRTPDGTVHAMIGDVCGHGPDEAALGVELRIAWRALTFAGLCGDVLLGTLQKVLEHERPNEEIFATLCTVDIAPDGRRAGLCLAGHPSPLVVRPGRPPILLPYEDSGPALGLLPRARWPRRQVELGGAWSLMMYTDGLIEGRIGEGTQRLGQEGMVAMVARQMADGLRGEHLLDAAVTEVRELNGGELTDDVAVLLLDRG
ncbi:PP2C family protein-serine/threonine phosphatase [Streptomyces sp. H27-D2]|uniref:PP2C family protein-serine/threonine phosphatase n=1 Tax=Streptomyces sp. H27-D2 TaxID=3046304 RepID=UPI002DB878F5|nr:SpoIIE family protein phosphatase [Streptomyces sp. H27-D2]MEC4015693.1 SpoIIE family protein phosphatase [Streptomyces sp. H27-D2]